MDKKRFRELFDSLTDEQKEKAKACKDVKELSALLGELDIALSDEQLDQVAGGQKATPELELALGQAWLAFEKEVDDRIAAAELDPFDDDGMQAIRMQVSEEWIRDGRADILNNTILEY